MVLNKIKQTEIKNKNFQATQCIYLKTLSWAETSASKFIICSSKIGMLAACSCTDSNIDI